MKRIYRVLLLAGCLNYAWNAIPLPGGRAWLEDRRLAAAHATTPPSPEIQIRPEHRKKRSENHTNRPIAQQVSPRADREDPIFNLIRQASNSSETQALETALKQGANLTQTNLYNRTPLSQTIADGPKFDSATGLHEAVDNGNLEIVQLLLRHRADVTSTYQQVTVYDLALLNQQDAIAPVLQQSKAGYGNREKLFERAVNEGNATLVQRLLDEGMDPNFRVAADWPILLVALRSRQSPQKRAEIVKLLVERGASIEIIPQRSGGLLHLVATEPELTEYLIGKGANPNVTDRSQMTPLHLAAHTGSPEVVAILLKHGVEVNARDDRGLTPLHRAAYGPANPRPVGSPLLDWKRDSPRYLETIRLLMEAGADANAQSKYGSDTPQDIASEWGRSRVAAARHFSQTALQLMRSIR